MTEQCPLPSDGGKPGGISTPAEFAQALDRLRRRSGRSLRALAAITGLGVHHDFRLLPRAASAADRSH